MLIKPLDNASNMVSLRFKDELKDLLTDTGPRVISDDNLPRLVRQLVVHINVSQCHALLSVQIFFPKKSNKIFDDLVNSNLATKYIMRFTTRPIVYILSDVLTPRLKYRLRQPFAIRKFLKNNLY